MKEEKTNCPARLLRSALASLPDSIINATNEDLIDAFLDMDADQVIRDTAQMVLECRSVASKPDHHIRYARAWMLHQSDDMTDEARLACEREMDAAQNLFTWDEFQAFKYTLEGFVEFWNRWASFVSQH